MVCEFEKVSIVTVSYNSAATIRDTIESVLGQDYPNIEYLVIDGGSKDETMAIVQEYADRIAVVISERDRGIYDAMNKGMLAASGDVVGFLNSDDMYADAGAVSKLMKRKHAAGTQTVFADLVLVDRNDTSKVVRYYDSRRFTPERLRYGWMPAHPTFLADRSLYEKWGGFSLAYRIAADFEMMVRLFGRAHATYSHLPDVVVRMRAGGVSTNGLRSSWVLNKEIVRACRENGISTSLPRVMMKIPAKLAEFVRRPGATRA